MLPTTYPIVTPTTSVFALPWWHLDVTPVSTLSPPPPRPTQCARPPLFHLPFRSVWLQLECGCTPAPPRRGDDPAGESTCLFAFYSSYFATAGCFTTATAPFASAGATGGPHGGTTRHHPFILEFSVVESPGIPR